MIYSYVSEIDESQVVSSSAYVLFYRRRDTLALSSVPPSLSTPKDEPDDMDGEEEPLSRPSPSSGPRLASMELD